MIGPRAVDTARVLVWNIEWKRPRSRPGQAIGAIIERAAPDIVCLTEAPADFLGPGYHVEASDADCGYGVTDRRKVLIASRQPWSDVSHATDSTLPPGRFVSGSTATTLGPLRATGICIPYAMAHVANGRRDRKQWQDHRAFLAALPSALPCGKGASVVVGDFNQTIPRSGPPSDVQPALLGALADYRIATAGCVDGEGRALIDHLATRSGTIVASLHHIGRRDDAGRKLSDHSGFIADLRLA
ncbi:MAG: endonuclease/exonuclease/phosphatase family protein [Sphingomonadaceae bacterium]|nr:endonuclease/exonuclease/phosphatase family protein [Sphingomonadaceae bacterium]